MRTNFFLGAMLTLLVLSGGSTDIFATNASTDAIISSQHSFKPGQLIIKRRSGLLFSQKPNEILSNSSTIKKFDNLKDIEVIQLPEGVSVKDALKKLLRDPTIEYATPDYYIYATDLEPSDPPVLEPSEPSDPDVDEPIDQTPLPNDPRFNELWGLHNSGQTGGTDGADINAIQAWALSTGKDVVIGVIDTGVNYKHEDLADNMWVNPGEIPDNGIDDDQNGYIDDIHGINAILKNGNPMDDQGHGTHVAGTIAAAMNNEIGVCGVAPSAKIIGCKFLDRRGGGSTSLAIGCLNYFVLLATREQNPVKVVATNNSWSGGPYSQPLFDAIKALLDNGILFMAAASNAGQDNDKVATYPANYNLANIVSVGAIDHNNKRAYFSNYGKHTVHVTAPGTNILSAWLEQGYNQIDGTSMATPHVAGLAALIKSNDPSRDWRAIKNLIMTGGHFVQELEDKFISGKTINAYDENGGGSLACEDQILQARLKPRREAAILPLGEKVDFSVINIKCDQPNGETSVLINGEDVLELKDDGQNGDSAEGDGVYTGSFDPDHAGSYQLTFFESGVMNVNIYDASSWHDYRPVVLETFNFREFEGEVISSGDDTTHFVSSPFPIKFAGDEYGFNSMYVGSNATISFTDDRVFGWQNKALPLSNATSVIAPFWDDLNGSRAREGTIFYGTLGEEPNREFVVEWREHPHYNSSANLITLQVVFFEGSSEILFNYKDVNLGNQQYDQGKSATIGIQTGSDKAALYSFNEASLSDESGILFTVNSKPSANAGADQTVEQGQMVSLDASLSADPDEGDSLSYSWELQNSKSLTLTSVDTPQTSFSSETLEGSYVINLTVTDSGGLSSTDAVKITVLTTKTAPEDEEPVATLDAFPKINRAPMMPTAIFPAEGSSIESLTTELQINNANDQDADTLVYEFEIYGDRDHSELLASYANVIEGKGGNTLVNLDSLVDEKSYYWRVRAFDSMDYSSWSYSRFDVLLKNLPPSTPQLMGNPSSKGIDNFPLLSIKNAVDPEGETLFYDFEIFDSKDLHTPIDRATDIEQGENGVTTWQSSKIPEDKMYYWRAFAKDKRGNLSKPSAVAQFRITTTETPPAPASCSQVSGSNTADFTLLVFVAMLALFQIRRKIQGKPFKQR